MRLTQAAEAAHEVRRHQHVELRLALRGQHELVAARRPRRSCRPSGRSCTRCPSTGNSMSFGFSTCTRTLNCCANMSVDSICTPSRLELSGDSSFGPSDAQPASVTQRGEQCRHAAERCSIGRVSRRRSACTGGRTRQPPRVEAAQHRRRDQRDAALGDVEALARPRAGSTPICMPSGTTAPSSMIALLDHAVLADAHPRQDRPSGRSSSSRARARSRTAASSTPASPR